MTPDPKPRPKAAGKLVDDPEIVAMATLAAVLDDLPVGVRGRVLRWLADRHGSQTTAGG